MEYLENIDAVESKIFRQHSVKIKKDKKVDKIIGFELENNKLIIVK